MVRNVVVVTSYVTLARRNGRAPLSNWLKAKWNTDGLSWSAEMLSTESKKFTKYTDFEGNLLRKFAGGILDEVQGMKGPNTLTSFAVRTLCLPWTLLVTATPTLWRHSGLIGLLSFVYNVKTDLEYSRMIKEATLNNTELKSPYALSKAGTLLNPSLRKYIATSSAYKHHVASTNDKVMDYEVGRCMSLVHTELGIIRRDYYSQIKVSPKAPNILRIGDLMPTCKIYWLVIEQTPLA